MQNLLKSGAIKIFLFVAILITLVSIKNYESLSQIEYQCDGADSKCLTIGGDVEIIIHGENPRVIIH